MMKFNWDRFRDENIAVHCDTEEKAEEFINECQRKGLIWTFLYCYGGVCWQSYKEDTCYVCGFGDPDSLGYENKKFCIEQGYEIIKWESEKMKFNVGDKVEAINGQYGEIIGFNALKEHSYRVKLQNGFCAYYREIELKLYKEPQTETFDIEYIIYPGKPGIYTSVDDELMLRHIIKLDDGTLTFGMREQDNGFSINYKEERFTYEEFKKLKTIYKVEFQVNGSHHDFISSQLLEDDEFVKCETEEGLKYGKIAERGFESLTETEIKEYKECWRA